MVADVPAYLCSYSPQKLCPHVSLPCICHFYLLFRGKPGWTLEHKISTIQQEKLTLLNTEKSSWVKEPDSDPHPAPSRSLTSYTKISEDKLPSPPNMLQALVGVYITLEVQPCLTVLLRGWRAEWFCPRAWVLVCSASYPSSVRELVLPGESYASSLSFRFLVCKMGGSLRHVMVNVFVYIMCLAWFLEHSEHPTNFS